MAFTLTPQDLSWRGSGQEAHLVSRAVVSSGGLKKKNPLSHLFLETNRGKQKNGSPQYLRPCIADAAVRGQGNHTKVSKNVKAEFFCHFSWWGGQGD